MLYALYFTACTAIGACKHVKVAIDCDNPPTVFECSMYGQMTVAKWAAENPGYIASRYSCGPDTKDL